MSVEAKLPGLVERLVSEEVAWLIEVVFTELTGLTGLMLAGDDHAEAI